MTAVRNEIKTYFGRCRCCLGYNYLKNMWEEYYWDGDKEVYVQMLVECFGLSWDQSNTVSSHDQICEACITRLRDAHIFKKTILQSQAYLLDNMEENKIESGIEDIAEAEDTQNEDSDDNKQDDSIYKSPCDYKNTNVMDESPNGTDENPDDSLSIDNSNEMNYERIEYLEDDDNEIVFLYKDLQKPYFGKRINLSDNNKNKKKLPRLYTEDELKECLESVKNKTLTLTEASDKYNISKTTIVKKFSADVKEHAKKFEIKQEKRIDFMKEVIYILTYTNAKPYKSQANHYCCAYCTTDSPCFENPNDLRIHMTSKHSEDRVEKIDQVLPSRMSEILKLDIHELQCVKCEEPIKDWNKMFKHLKEIHAIDLKYAYTKAIPYDLTDKLKCALCQKEFAYYMHLDAHMNTHYNNYVCTECGDTFVAETRWKRHLRSHNTDKHVCSFCEKSFPTLKLKNKHEEIFHDQLPKFKCDYCEDRFSGEYLRHMHLIEKHMEKVEVMRCDFCGETFTWRPYFRRHKRQHTEVKRFKCEECGKKYYSQNELKDHMLRHSDETSYKCHICEKQYVSLSFLKRHLYKHKFDQI